MKLAFLGLGVMGFPMAGHLAKAGHEVTVYNRTATKAQAWAAQFGGAQRTSPAEAAKGAEIVFTCVGNDDDVRHVVLGETGALAGMAKGAILIDHTTASAELARELDGAAKARGLGFLDAPVSGGQAGAESGKLTVMVGGDAAVLQAVRPAIEAFAGKIVHCGPVGAGDAVKAVNQAFLAIHLLAAAEGLVTLVKQGVDPKVALDVINASSGRSNSSMNLIPERVITRAFPKTFRLALLEKDIGIAAELARQNRVPSPVTQLTADLFRVARGELGEVADHVEVVKMVEQWGGAEIR